MKLMREEMDEHPGTQVHRILSTKKEKCITLQRVCWGSLLCTEDSTTSGVRKWTVRAQFTAASRPTADKSACYIKSNMAILGVMKALLIITPGPKAQMGTVTINLDIMLSLAISHSKWWVYNVSQKSQVSCTWCGQRPLESDRCNMEPQN